MADRWRTGRKVPVHLYRLVGDDEPSDADVAAGTALTPELARELVDDANLGALVRRAAGMPSNHYEELTACEAFDEGYTCGRRHAQETAAEAREAERDG